LPYRPRIFFWGEGEGVNNGKEKMADLSKYKEETLCEKYKEALCET